MRGKSGSQVGIVLAVAGCFWASGAMAQLESAASGESSPGVRLACERLEAQISQSIRDNGARHFLLEVVENAQVDGDVVRAGEAFAGAEVVGSCDGGTRKVVYSRQGATEMSAPDSMMDSPEASTLPAEESAASPAEEPSASPYGEGSAGLKGSAIDSSATLPESSGEAVPGESPDQEDAQEPESSP